MGTKGLVRVFGDVAASSVRAVLMASLMASFRSELLLEHDLSEYFVLQLVQLLRTDQFSHGKGICNFLGSDLLDKFHVDLRVLLQYLLNNVGLRLLLDLIVRFETCAPCPKQVAPVVHLLDVGHHADNVVEVVLPDS